jgi:hypothetical protein
MKISLKKGSFSLEYEGDEAFLSKELTNILSVLEPFVSSETPERIQLDAATATKAAVGTSADVTHSTNTIARLINASTGPDLIMAAVAKLAIVDGASIVRRNEIHDEMRKATSYYKRTFQNNLSTYLSNLVKADRLRLVSQDTYGLPAKERDKLEQSIAQA